MEYQIIKPSFPPAGSGVESYWKYLSSIGIPAGDLRSCCLKKAEVTGIDSFQTVKINCEGDEYSNIPVWVHTDQGARQALVKEEEITEGDYFKNAALMFPLPGGISTSKGTTKTPEVLALCLIDSETQTFEVLGIISVLQAMFSTFTAGPFKTYRFLIKITFFNYTTAQEYAVYDIINDEIATLPTYDSNNVPTLPLFSAEKLPTDTDIDNLLDVGFRVPSDFIYASTIRYGLSDVCHHEDGSTSEGWTIVSNIQEGTHITRELAANCYQSATASMEAENSIGGDFTSLDYLLNVPVLYEFDEDNTPLMASSSYPDGQLHRNVSPLSSDPVGRVTRLNDVNQPLYQYRRPVIKNSGQLFEINNSSNVSRNIHAVKDGVTVVRNVTESYTDNSDTGRTFTYQSINTLTATMGSSLGGQIWPDNVVSGEVNTQSILVTEYFTLFSTANTFIFNSDIYLEFVNVKSEIRRESIPASVNDYEYTDPIIVSIGSKSETDQDCLIKNNVGLVDYIKTRINELFNEAGRDYETNHYNNAQYFRNTFTVRLDAYIVPYDVRESLL